MSGDRVTPELLARLDAAERAVEVLKEMVRELLDETQEAIDEMQLARENDHLKRVVRAMGAMAETALKDEPDDS